MGDEGSAGLVRRAYEAFAARDRDGLVELADPEVELHLVTNPLAHRSGPYRGHEGIREYLDDVEAVWDEVDLQPHQFAELPDDRLLVLGRVRSRRGSTRIDVPSAWLWETAGGKVTSVRLMVDSESVASLLAAR